MLKHQDCRRCYSLSEGAQKKMEKQHWRRAEEAKEEARATIEQECRRS